MGNFFGNGLFNFGNLKGPSRVGRGAESGLERAYLDSEGLK